MSLSCRGRVPRDTPVGGRLLGVCIFALIVSGCAHETQSPYAQTNWYAGGPKSAPAVPIPVEMEDDGRPAQLPPAIGVRHTQDDPNEPWSPNYGGPARPLNRAPVGDVVAAKPAPGKRQLASADREE